MNEILLHQTAEHRRTFAFIFEKDDRPLELLAQVAEAHGLASAQITAIGAFSSATLGYFERERRTYRRIPIDEQSEVVSLIGDIAFDQATRVIHAHCVLGLGDGSTRGGHLLDAVVWPTLEMIVTEWPSYLIKRFDSGVGLALVDRGRTLPPT